MVVLKIASDITRCPFSKKLIKPNDKICLFNQEQFNAFSKIINEQLQLILLISIPIELIDLIIEKTRYEKFIGRFGHVDFAHWTKTTKTKKPKITIYNEESSDDESD